MKGINQKDQIASVFSKSASFWKNIYDPSHDHDSRCYSRDMVERKNAVFYMLKKYGHKFPLSILDTGCGPGVYLETALERGHSVTGIDISENMLLTAKNSILRRAAVARADIEYLPFRNSSFDAIFCIGVLSYLPADDQSMKELHRVVRPGGLIIMGLPNWLRLPILLDPYYYLYRVFFNFRFFKNKRKNENPVKEYRRYFKWELNRLSSDLDLRLLEVISIGFGPLTFFKKEFIPSKYSIKLSSLMEKYTSRFSLSFLRMLTNHWVICWQKGEG